MSRALPMRVFIAALLTLPVPAGYSAAADATDSEARIFRDCPDCPEMVTIPAGEFVMGAAVGEEDRESLAPEFRDRSVPQRRVTISRFSASRHEITRRQFRMFVDATGHRSESCFVWEGDEYRMDPAKSWRNPGFAQDENHPVVCVSWEDALAYVRWLSAKTSRQYRLLSEAEWEYAARGGQAASRFWGDNAAETCFYGNGADRRTVSMRAEARDWPSLPCDDGFAHTAPAGSFRANAFGLYDMLGNAAEWTADCWNPGFHGAPSDNRAWTNGECFRRAVRGGGWDEGAASLRSAYRVGSPVVIRVYSRGFRVAIQN